VEPSPPASVGASVDLGSNSVHLLVAAIAGHRLQPLADESVFLGLGDAVHDGGPLGAAKRAELVVALETYADTARRLGATSITFIGTEPLRRAADAARIVHDVVHASGVPLHVLSHEEEAYLTLIGVTEGRPVTHETLVVDIGGGSSEFATVGPNRPAAAAGLRLGSARLTSRHVANDPPTTAEVAAIGRTAREILAGAVTTAPSEIVGVGGTVSNLVKVLPAAFADRTLTRRRIAEIQEILASEPAALASQRHLVNPIRARLLPAGGAIVDAILERYGVDEMRVSEAGIREGTVFAVQHAGPSWRDRLADLARGWRT
jgi:exopolyphosphatase/guanosine-5'-triphosphate,3'-diphosphate pyrophosphatase